MATSSTMAPGLVTASELRAAGFTADEVTRLVTERTRYTPFRELFTTREFQRLSFIRWQVEQGRIQL